MDGRAAEKYGRDSRRRRSPPAGRVKMLLLLLLVALTSPFQELVPAIDGDSVPSSKDKRATGEVTMKIVGGTITNIKNYPFLVSEMRP